MYKPKNAPPFQETPKVPFPKGYKVELPTQEQINAVVKRIEELETNLSRCMLLLNQNTNMLTVKQFADRCGMSPDTVRRLISNHEIQHVQHVDGGKISIPITEVLKFVQL